MCKLDNKEVITDLSTVRELGVCNMFDLSHVIISLKQLGYTTSAVFLEENRHLYIDLLKQIK